MEKAKFDLLLDRLVDKTNKNELEWKLTEDRDTFLLNLNGNSIEVRNILDHGFIVYVKKPNGNLIDYLTLSEDHSEFDKVKQLYKLIESSVVSEKNMEIDQILEQLAA